jgi:hypothetical protein
MSNKIELHIIDKRHSPAYCLGLSKMNGYWSIGLRNINDHTVQLLRQEDLIPLASLIQEAIQENKKLADEEIRKHAVDLRKKGKSIRQIASIMGFKNPGSITNLLKK